MSTNLGEDADKNENFAHNSGRVTQCRDSYRDRWARPLSSADLVLADDDDDYDHIEINPFYKQCLYSI